MKRQEGLEKKAFMISAMLIFLLFSAQLVQAGAFATIAMTGLNFVNPVLGKAVSTAICLSGGVVVCVEKIVEGKIVGVVVGKIYEESYKAVAEGFGKETANSVASAFSTYNTVKGYVDMSAQIIEELKLDENGKVTEGKISFEKEAKLDKSFFEKLTTDISVANVDYNAKSREIRFKENGRLEIKSEEKTFVYENIKKGGKFVLDEKGNLKEADITSSAQATYIFGENKPLTVPADTKIVYKEGIITVEGKGKEFLFGTSKIAILDDSINIEKKTIRGKKFRVGDSDISGMYGRLGAVDVEEGKIVKVWRSTDALINGIRHKVYAIDRDINIYYDEQFDPQKYKGENYFGYGSKNIWIGGNGFESIIEKDNAIFPEYVAEADEETFVSRKGKLSFLMIDGTLEVEKASPDGKPLALMMKSEGSLVIRNGAWEVFADGENVYAYASAKEGEWPIGFSTRFDYRNEKGEKLIYDLNVDTLYVRAIGDEERKKLGEEIEKLEEEGMPLWQEKRKIFEESKESEEIYYKIDDLLYKLKSRTKNLEEEQKRWEGRLKEVLPEQRHDVEKEMEERLSYITEEIIKIDKKMKEIEEQNPELAELAKKIFELNEEIWGKERLINYGRKTYGSFGQVLINEEGNIEVAYSEFVRGIPVIKNTDIRMPYYGVFEGGYVSSSRSFVRNHIERGKYDVVNLASISGFPENVISPLQQCADTQLFIRAVFEKKLYDEKIVDDIKFTLANGKEWSWNEAQKIGYSFERYIEYAMTYINSGTIMKSTEAVKNVDDIIAGDMLVYAGKSGYGDTKAVKEIQLINGKKYFVIFGGSDPAQDAEIVKGLRSEKEMEDAIKDGEIKRWKKLPVKIAKLP